MEAIKALSVAARAPAARAAEPLVRVGGVGRPASRRPTRALLPLLLLLLPPLPSWISVLRQGAVRVAAATALVVVRSRGLPGLRPALAHAAPPRALPSQESLPPAPARAARPHARRLS